VKEDAVEQSDWWSEDPDRVIEQAREQKEFSREDTSTEKRVEVGFLIHAGLRIAALSGSWTVIRSRALVVSSTGAPVRAEPPQPLDNRD